MDVLKIIFNVMRLHAKSGGRIVCCTRSKDYAILYSITLFLQPYLYFKQKSAGVAYKV
jgi:hypothetical protein